MEQMIATYILLVGIIIVISIFIKYGFRSISLPAMTGYFLIGFVLRIADDRWHLLQGEGYAIIEFLADLGIIAMLLKIGLESKIFRLVKWLPRAAIIWVADIFVSGSVGFLAAYFLIGWGLIPSLFVGTAFTATSVGISLNIWDEVKAVDTESGQILLDVAEMDDISGILLMGVLFALVPVIHQQGALQTSFDIPATVGLFLVKLVLFGGICILFSRYVAEKLMEWLNRLHGGESMMMIAVGMGLIVASISGLMGFSFAIGAFFVGIILNSNPTRVKVDLSFDALHVLFVPFFFISIGLNLSPSTFQVLGFPLVALLAASFLGKYLGAGAGTWASIGAGYASIIGISMIPRAEIFLIIMKRGLDLGPWAVSDELFAYTVIISAASAIVIPPILRLKLQHNRSLLDKVNA